MKKESIKIEEESTMSLGDWLKSKKSHLGPLYREGILSKKAEYGEELPLVLKSNAKMLSFSLYFGKTDEIRSRIEEIIKIGEHAHTSNTPLFKVSRQIVLIALKMRRR